MAVSFNCSRIPLYFNLQLMPNVIKGIASGKCPKCGRGNVFPHPFRFFALDLPKMNRACPNCGHVFEKETGFFWGAMFVSYGLTVLEAVVIFLICQLFFHETFDDSIMYIIAGSIIVLARFNYRVSQLIWMYMFTSKNRDL